MKRHISFIFYLLVSVVGFSQTEEIQFSHISTSEGLSQSSVIAIHQDKMGQMWFGTRDGLNKYDGNSFTIYRTNTDDKNAISNNDILSILEDSEGYLWIGTYNGLNKYDPEKDTFTNYFYSSESNSVGNNIIRTITEMSNGELWVGTSVGISVFNKKTNAFTNIFNKTNDSESLIGNNVLSILETKNNDIWIGTESGLSNLINRSKNGFIFKNYEALEIDKKPIYVQDLIEDKNNNILISTKNNGILFINTLEKKIKNYLPKEQQEKFSKNIRKLAFDNDDNLWIGTYDGVSVLRKNKRLLVLKHETNNAKSISKNSVKSIFKDKKGSVWIGTYYGGLNLWDDTNTNFINFSENNNSKSINYNVISSIEKYKNQLIFGTEGKGINFFNKENNNVTYLEKSNYPLLPDNNIKSLFVDNNTLWVGTFNNGIAIYNIEKNKFKEDKNTKKLREFLQNKSVYAIKKDANNTIWFGTFGDGIVNYNLSTNILTFFKNNYVDNNSLSNNLVKSIVVDSKNTIWIGTQKGLNSITNNNQIKRYLYNNSLQNGADIAAIFEDKNNTIWVGTKAKGLFKLEQNTFIKVPVLGANSNVYNIHSILEDKKNNLWISTNNGIIKYNITSEKSKIYNQKDGLVSNEFNDNASLKTGDSQFYFGGPNGITSFNTQYFTTNTYAPQVLITDFKVKNKSVKVNQENGVLKKTIGFTKEISLNHTKGNFSLEFAIPNFINPKNNSYQYRLRGLEEDWVFTSENTANYTIQNPGKYTFEVKGANSDGVWNTTATSLKIIVKPAPWKSWWAFLLYTIIIFLALYYLISILKSKTALKHQLDLEHLENEKIEETNKAKLEFFTNISHEFRTPLTLILGPLHQVLENYKGSSKMYKKLLVIESSANHLLSLINRLMDFRKLEKNLFKLEAAEGNIVKFLKEIYLSFSEYANDGDYDYSFHTTENEILVYYDRYKLERVFYNLISNAFRYTPKNGTISIRIKTENNKLLITVEDSGVGVSKEYKDKIFDRFFEVSANNNPEKNYNKGTGIGLSIAKNIVTLHKGKISVKNNTNGLGSIFLVSLPLGNKHLKEDEIIKDFKFSDDLSQYVSQLEKSNTVYKQEIEDQIIKENVPSILIVEDNKPLRSFMKNLLKEDYNVLEAENGKVALKLALKYTPNLIVSDVVMPVMAGTELCAEIKKNIKTSHIPIILLTSRTSLIYKLEGLESGADDYISKPFNIKEFKLRIKNILETSTKQKEKYTGEDSLLPNEVIVSSLDEKLFKKALEIVDKNISNEEFDIPYFCSELGVSRTMLFIKIKAWTTFTPNDFIQHFRMKRAAQLLEQGKINISEVSYKVGFKNPKYFSKCFYKKYGETPTQYSNKFSDY